MSLNFIKKIFLPLRYLAIALILIFAALVLKLFFSLGPGKTENSDFAAKLSKFLNKENQALAQGSCWTTPPGGGGYVSGGEAGGEGCAGGSCSSCCGY